LRSGCAHMRPRKRGPAHELVAGSLRRCVGWAETSVEPNITGSRLWAAHWPNKIYFTVIHLVHRTDYQSGATLLRPQTFFFFPFHTFPPVNMENLSILLLLGSKHSRRIKNLLLGQVPPIYRNLSLFFFPFHTFPPSEYGEPIYSIITWF
jgi:hypothetical protein